MGLHVLADHIAVLKRDLTLQGHCSNRDLAADLAAHLLLRAKRGGAAEGDDREEKDGDLRDHVRLQKPRCADRENPGIALGKKVTILITFLPDTIIL